MNATNDLNKHSSTNVAVRRPETARTDTEWTYRPNVDIVDTDSAIEVHADLPGANGEAIDVAFEQGILSINAPVTHRHDESWKRVVTEFGVGNFHRRFQIDAQIDSEKIAADYTDGVLKVTLPKAREAQRRKIPVKA
jgi:HSP20 family molecular chaperone IbpA